MDFSASDLILANLALLVGAIVHGTVGFGMIMVAAPFLVLISPHFFPGPAVLVGFTMPLLVALRHWRQVETGPIGYALIGRVAGTAIAAYALYYLSPTALAFVVGWMVLGSVLLSASGYHPPQTRMGFGCVGIASGIMGITSALGGVPIGLSYRNPNPDAYRATVSGFLTLGASLSIITLAATGRLGSTEIKTALFLLPGLAIGFLAAIPLTNFLRSFPLKPIAQILSAAAAVFVIARNWPR